MRNFQYNLINYLQNKPKSFSMALAILWLFLIGYFDFLVSPYISVSILYLIPVVKTTWLVGESAGCLISIASVLISLAIDPMEKYSLQNSWIPYWNACTILIFYIIIVYLICEIKKLLEREKTLARTDYLTGVPNSKAFFELAEFEINRANRYRYPLTIAYIDLDNFKKINDKLGQQTGDLILRIVAETIKSDLRVTDIIARLGGDEFAILLPETPYDPGQKVIRRIQRKLLEAMKKREWSVTFSIGAVTFIKILPKSVEEMIERADNLMYFVKHNGKNMIKHERFGES